jgi:hypothetical protein
MKISKIAVLALLTMSASAFANTGSMGVANTAHFTADITCSGAQVTLAELKQYDFSKAQESQAQANGQDLINQVKAGFSALAADIAKLPEGQSNHAQDVALLTKDFKAIAAGFKPPVATSTIIAHVCTLANFMHSNAGYGSNNRTIISDGDSATITINFLA